MRHISRDPSEELHRRVLEDLGGAAGPLPALPPAAPLLQLRGQAPGHLTIILYTTSFTTQMLSTTYHCPKYHVHVQPFS